MGVFSEVKTFSEVKPFGGFPEFVDAGGLLLALVDIDRRLGPRVWFCEGFEDNGATSSSSVSLSVSLPSSLLKDSQPDFPPRNLLATRRGHMISPCLAFKFRMSDWDRASHYVCNYAETCQVCKLESTRYIVKTIDSKYSSALYDFIS